MANEILINQLFAGSYLDEGENIGHEVINLFKDDNGNNNLYITPSGDIGKHELEYVIFVRNESARRMVEVICLAKDFSTVSEDVENIRYGGVTLGKIFRGNKYHNNADIFPHITFRADHVYFPTRRVYITLDEGIEQFDDERKIIRLNSDKQVIIPQGMRTYFSEKDDTEAYSQLKELVEDTELWKEENTDGKLIPDGAVSNPTPTFLEVIRKENDENILSNLLAYFFEYSPRTFKKFAEDKKLLDIEEMSLFFDVERETKDRVDIWIESDREIIVIENKIKSGINGVKGDYSQLNKYLEKANDEAKNDNKNVHCYIFAPDYAKLNLSPYGSEVEKAYKIIRYSEIYNFFIREAEKYMADRLFPDFVRSLKRHTLSYSDMQFETMRSRLLRKINTLQRV